MTVREALADNVNTIAFVAGLGVFYAGLAGFSVPAANVALGLLLMTVSTWPYVTRRRMAENDDERKRR